ncbi:ATP-binding protein [Primorskyibacter sp. S187A]|uniref:hybrid sensor histidine kinase/response regulator n=1 Tax=Primorskyibacter sp. S187A TaxID=3415130 RepID=UPI003C7CEEC1
MLAKLPKIKRQTWAAILFVAPFVVVLVAAFILGRDVFEDLERQRTASSDNVQWTLTQVEVEYLSYLNALDHLVHEADGGNPLAQNELRKRFDVFYSRVDTLHASPLFAELRATPAYSIPLAVVRGYLTSAVPVIDSASLTQDVISGELLEGAEAIQDDIRALSLSGLSYFANLSDARRTQTAQTLARLGMMAGALLFMLVTLAGYLLFINRKMRQRGRALRQANNRVRTVMATSLDAVIIVNSDGHVLEFNPAAEQIFGRTRAEALGQSVGDLVIPQNMRAAHAAGMERMKEGGERHVVGKGRVQLEAVRANGEVFPVELALESAFDGSEEIVIGYIRDISKRVAAQEELISARDEALAGEKAKDNFLTVMSHEIRTPLNGLLGNLSLLTNSKLTGDQKQLTHNMQVSGQVLMNHVDSVLDIARFEAGKLSAAREAVDLSALMQDLVDGQSGNAASKGNAIEWQWVGPARPWVLSDAQRLRQILLNLVGNAIKFTDKGRISLEVECSPTTDPERTEYEFRVIDTGIGIAETDQARVFDDFETSDPSISRNVSGTGLGLGIAKRFVAALGGEIGVESEPGAGSVFWVRLPMEETAPGPVKTDTQDARAVDSRLDVLVVEDNEINSEVVRRMLELDGHAVTLAENGQAGVDAARVHRFDVILMDISMPVMDGPTATRQIRAGDGKSRATPIIAVSANVLPGATESFREAGMNAFLGKPLTVESLRHALSTILHGSVESLAPPPQQTSTLDDLKAQLGADKTVGLLGKFIAEADDVMARLKTQDLHAEGLAEACHKLAGSAGLFGLEALRAALVSCETHLKEGRIEEARSAAQASEAAWSRTRPALLAEL